MTKQKFTPPIRKGLGIAAGRDNILYNIESLLEPLVIMLTVWGIAFWFERQLTTPYFILAAFLFYITFPCSSKLHMPVWQVLRNITLTWLFIASITLVIGYLAGFLRLFDSKAIIVWLWLTPIAQLSAVFVLRVLAPVILALQGKQKKAIVVGINERGATLADSLHEHRYNNTTCVGYFDDRHLERFTCPVNFPILGKFNQIADYVKHHHIDVIYLNVISLSTPADSQSRITKILDDLKDTTASIYLVPDSFLSDIIQGRIGQVGDIPVMALCETPIYGANSMIKRLMDLFISITSLILLSPALILIAMTIKLSSPGPIIFKQRRYGLDGKEISVYKFRSMTTSHVDGEVIQAKKHDVRVTPFGAFLRKTSLDELPQLVNVIQGRMSLVGPRPHAVVHNEMYRKLIKGYMIRHKVKPGITGWAQVNGFRGETETLDKMQTRIDYDIDYLRHWSARLDIYIILKTFWVIIKGQDSAY